MGFAVFAETEL